jgi:hypothetical protein
MTEERIGLQKPLKVAGTEIQSFVIDGKAIFGLTAKGERTPISTAALAHINGQLHQKYGYQNEASMIKNIIDATPIEWQLEGDAAVATTLGGRAIRMPIQQALEVTGTFEPQLAIQILNAPLQAKEKLGTPIAIGVLAGALAKGIAGQIGSYVGGLIIDAIFPQKPLQDYFDEMYQKISQMVHKEIVSNQIQLINGKISGTQAFIRNVYKVSKESGTPRAKLSDMLDKYVDDFYLNVTYTLQTENYRQPGFSVFLLGASMHLSMLQEKALLTDKPRESSFAKTVQNQAKDYLEMAKATWKEILDIRLSKLEMKTETWKNPYGQGGGFLRGRIIDHYINATIYETSSVLEWLLLSGRRFDEYQAQLTAELSKGFAGEDGIDKLFEHWQLLESNPIPKL